MSYIILVGLEHCETPTSSCRGWSVLAFWLSRAYKIKTPLSGVSPAWIRFAFGFEKLIAPESPHHRTNWQPEMMRQAIRQARSELKVGVMRGERLRYIGAQAVQVRLRDRRLAPLPGTTSALSTMI